MKYFSIAILLFCSISAEAQADSTLVEPADSTDTIPKYWKSSAVFGLNGTQTSFVNWSAGGRNNISVLSSITANAVYEKNNFIWTNDFNFALGGLQYIEKEAKEGLQKTDDKIDLSTKFGHKFQDKFYSTLLAGFRTQLLDGFAYPNDSVRVSKFMAPGYVNAALGVDYIPNENFSMLISPFAMKLTIVNDRVLANQGAFGVQAASYDGLGNVITEGKLVRAEFGAYFKAVYNKTIAKNIDMRSKLELFTNYLENPQNIDVNADVNFFFKVNSWFSASLEWTLIYDNDIDITDSNGNTGPRTQFKSVIGLGISYKIKNYKE